ncbi:hypothetical protein LZZ90_01065 [Flavobacterium sp. SM15]|uniref:hypothetical protein n=1 Tax=Flavobacterium sp. SM15 TaxID=2908005 RepID=UPI001EDA0B01|nr:hypothetical protein [Flavobacterium sp. SM15]MCG2610091.1 hypothetical protein [Flavobacterium sp. SM15]
MKKLLFSLAILGSIFTGCSKDDEDENTQVTPQVGEISGNITANKTYAYGNYTLKGIVRVKAGATLTIDAGSTVTCDKANGDNALVIENGAKLIVNGTESAPVIFTELSKVPGSWGGIIMYGDAPAKVLGGGTTSISEDGLSLSYGGTNANHNGGSLNYVRVEYAGKKLADGTKELNGFSFYSVGAGTTLNHLVSYMGADDGFEFYGGNVSLKNAISYGNYDDSFDWQDGWYGQENTNWYAYQVNKGNFGIEIEASANNNTFWPKFTNVTLKRANGCTPEVAGDVQVDAIQFKKEGNGDFTNVVIDGYGSYTEAGTTYQGAAIKIQDASTNTNQVNGSKIKLTNVKITNTAQVVAGASGSIVVTFPTGQFTTSTTSAGASLTPGAWSTANGSNLLQ